MQSEINATQKEMPNVLFVVGLDIAQMVIRLFKLSLDKKIWTMRVVGFFVRFEHGLAAIAGEGRSGYVVSMKLHGSVPATGMSSHGANGAMYRNLSISFCGRQTWIPFETDGLGALHEIRCGVARSTEQVARRSFCSTSSRRHDGRPRIVEKWKRLPAAFCAR